MNIKTKSTTRKQQHIEIAKILVKMDKQSFHAYVRLLPIKHN